MALSQSFFVSNKKIFFICIKELFHISMIMIMLFILTQTSFYPHREVVFFRVRNPVSGYFFNFIKLILPGPGFEPVTSSISMPLWLQVGDALAFSAI